MHEGLSYPKHRRSSLKEGIQHMHERDNYNDGMYHNQHRDVGGLYRKNIEHVVNDLRSIENRIPIRINFINKTSEDLIVMSTDRKGNQQVNGLLKHRQTMSKRTYATHPWMLSRNKQKICVYIPERNLTHNTEINLTVMPNFEVIIQNARTGTIIHRHSSYDRDYLHHNDK